MDPLSQNRYAYTQGNPVNYQDPSGQNPTAEALSVIGAGGVAIPEGITTAVGIVLLIIAIAIDCSESSNCESSIAVDTVEGVSNATYNSYLLEQRKEEVREKTIAITGSDKVTFIYRRGSGTAYNLTPREVDELGLSYNLTPPVDEKYTITSLELLNSTKVLWGKIDGPNHVSVNPVNPTEMIPWIQSRETANESPYYLTKVLMSISIKNNGQPCLYED